MKNTEIAAACGFSMLCHGDEREVAGVFTGDLLSWAMANVQEGHAWCTVMGNINTIAVATLSDCACVVLCHGVQPDPDVEVRAQQQGVTLLSTQLPEFEASLALAKALGIAT